MQDDLKFTIDVGRGATGQVSPLSGDEGARKKKYADSETLTDVFDVKNAYLDLNNQDQYY